jgi:hypothetical protein
VNDDLIYLRYWQSSTATCGFRIRHTGDDPADPDYTIVESGWYVDVSPTGPPGTVAGYRIDLALDEHQVMSCQATWGLHLRIAELGAKTDHSQSILLTTSLTTALTLAAEAARQLVAHPPHDRSRMPVLLRQTSKDELIRLVGLIASYEAREADVVQPLLDLLIGEGIIDDWEIEMPCAKMSLGYWQDVVKNPIAKLCELGLLPGRRSRSLATMQQDLIEAFAAIDYDALTLTPSPHVDSSRELAAAIRRLFRTLKIPHLSVTIGLASLAIIRCDCWPNSVDEQFLSDILSRAFPENLHQHMGDLGTYQRWDWTLQLWNLV